MLPGLQDRFEKYLTSEIQLDSESRLLLAVSGGIDSMVMTHLFQESGREFSIVHCNFQLRGSESDQDELFIREFAAKWKMPLFVQSFKTSEYARERKISLQMAARDLRVEWFSELMNRHRFSYTALAHNKNDNAETFLINLIRGTGISGMTGIRSLSGRFIRPLLFASRDEISRYAQEQNIDYREDSSNREQKYTRNRIRHSLIPVMKEINPSVIDTLGEVTSRMGEIDIICDSYASSIRQSLLMKSETGYTISINQAMALTPLNTSLYMIFKEFGVTGAMIPEIKRMSISTSGSVLSTSSHNIFKDRSHFIIEPVSEDIDEETLIFNSKDELIKGFTRGSATIVDTDSNTTIEFAPGSNYIALEKITFPLSVRGWRKGDYFYPLGMKGRKKLSDFFTDRKYTAVDKKRAQLLISDDDIVCIIGDRTDERFKIGGDTRRVLVISDKRRVKQHSSRSE